MYFGLRTAIFAVFLYPAILSGQNSVPAASKAARRGVWVDVAEQTIKNRLAATRAKLHRRDIIPKKYRTLHVDKAALKQLLKSAAPESSGPIETNGLEFVLPLPDGRFERFLIQESPILEPELAVRFPELKTFVGRGLDDPTATVRMDITPRGFHAIVLSASGQTYIDPYSRDTDEDYISYSKRDFSAAEKPFSCLVENSLAPQPAAAGAETATGSSGETLRTYRLALACTAEYAAAVCSPSAPTVSGTLGAMITSVNRCSAIYERELAVRFSLVANNDRLIYLNPANDPYSNSDGSTMLAQNQSNIDTVIGSANYDFGHVFSTGGGGIAYLGVICVSGAKARGVTGLGNPLGDPFDVDYVAHEIGHQFGADHPFNGTSGSCQGNSNASTAYEPGSGSTIMAYAGLCAGQNLASYSDAYFHAISYAQISSFASGTTGRSCAQINASGNTPPSIGPLPAFTIPSQTPFSLTAPATDADADTLTYCWEEFDLGSHHDPTQSPRDNGSSPLFRSYPPATTPTRIFPSLTYILNNQNIPPATNFSLATGEFLPTTSRTMNFRVTVRDNHPGAGGVTYASTTITSVSSAGPFAITSHNVAASIAGGSAQTVTWLVANTNTAPISCANVRISLSTDGGNTFPIVLASSVPNNGSATVTIPNIANVATTQGRIKVEAAGNIFFDISDANLTVTSTNNAPILNISGGITVVRGKPAATIATVGTVSDAQGDPVSVAVSNVPFGANVTPTISNGSISLAATADCSVTTTTVSRTYPITLTVTDSKGSTASARVNLTITPNPSPSLGAYSDTALARGSSANITPAAALTDNNGNLNANPFSVTPATLPGGGGITINQSTGVVSATATGATTLGPVPVRVTVVDSCGAAAVRIFNINVVSGSIPSLQSATPSSPTSEGCAPLNGAVDPGETVIINLPISNTGGTATSNLVGTLQASGGVSPVTASQSYGVIPAGGSVTRAYQFSATGTCGGNITATLQLQDGASNYGVVTYSIRLGALPVLLSQSFDSVSAPALPAGWTAVVASGGVIPWGTNSNAPDSSPNSATAATVEWVSDNSLVSPAVSIPGNGAQLSFRHLWNLEDGYDGGVLEISVNGGPYTGIQAAGGTFVSGGYNGIISDKYRNPIGGSASWTGDGNLDYITTVVNLPTSSFGQSARLRWRLGSDDGFSDQGAGWRIDNVVLIGNSYACAGCSSAPAITNGPPPSTVVIGAPYNFAFNSSGNPAPTFSLKSGTLPPGLTLSAGGVLSGTVTSGGGTTYSNIVVSASNGNSPEASQTFSLTIVTQAASYLGGFGLSGANAGLLYDYDRDGIFNLAEYALNLNPTIATLSGAPAVSIKRYTGKDYLSITFQRSSAATDLTYTAQASSDLVNWTNLASSVAGAPTSGPGLVDETGTSPNFTVEVRDTVSMANAPGGRRFLRLKISSP